MTMEKKYHIQETTLPMCAEESLQPYTMEELHTRLEESELDFEAGRCHTTEEVLQMCGMEQMHLVAV